MNEGLNSWILDIEPFLERVKLRRIFNSRGKPHRSFQIRRIHLLRVHIRNLIGTVHMDHIGVNFLITMRYIEQTDHRRADIFIYLCFLSHYLRIQHRECSYSVLLYRNFIPVVRFLYFVSGSDHHFQGDEQMDEYPNKKYDHEGQEETLGLLLHYYL